MMMDAPTDSCSRTQSCDSNMNVNSTERWVSAFAGGLLAAWGMKKANFSGLGLAILGGAMMHRGLSGQCSLYQKLGISTV